ncbi:restriction endonuclease [Thiohalomonas denitrificans]|uniref:Restriction system protein n=1 Tax=Thiohalomonas denitrificans TaxID=415747 RepID=A0A1G5QVK6_9GAMM|nr:restriction endonuclease [Thiohalomonas denitrificans]SCZ65301.1 restriction system protein [Thiohalomonas denitrificans]
MPIPDYQTLMRPFLARLADGRVHRLAHLRNDLVEEFQLSPEEVREKLASGRQTVFSNRLGWAKTYMDKAGLLETPKRAHYRITDRGRRALEECPDAIDNDYLKHFEEFRAFVSQKKDHTEAQVASAERPSTPDEQIAAVHQALNSSLADDLLGAIQTASPGFFEQLVVDLMIAMGYGGSRKEAGEATQSTNDDGIDGIIKEDRLGLDTIYLQAKRWQNTVHRPEIDKFIGSLTRNRARKGVFITTSEFSPGAREAVHTLDMKVILIDGQQLAELMIEHNLGVTPKEVYEVKQVDSDYFSEDN